MLLSEADIPVPSIECETSIRSDRETIPSSSVDTTRWSTPRSHLVTDTVWEQTNALQQLRLNSPRTPDRCPQFGSPDASFRASSSITKGLENLRLQSQQSTPVRYTTRSIYSPSPSSTKSYQVECEDPPNTPFHHVKFQQALSDARSCISKVMKVLSSSNLHEETGSTIQSLYQQAKLLKSQQLPSSRIVAMIGDSAVGKSSLINSLLDKPDLARASGKGAACTCTVTEYVYHDSDKFIIHVEYFSLSELKHQFEHLLRVYRNSKSPENDAASTEKQKEEVTQNKEAIRECANLAIQTFQAIFDQKLEENPEVLSCDEFDEAIKTMVKWTQLILPNSQDQETFDNVNECADRLGTLTSETTGSSSRSGLGWRWPLIKSMRVYLRAVILSKGLILADVPGLRDINPLRSKITEEYIRRCDQIFAVLPIDRAASNQSLRDIFRLAEDANLQKIDIVCTKSEDVRFEEAKRDWKNIKKEIIELEKKLNKAEAMVDELGSEVERINSHCEAEDKKASDDPDFRDLTQILWEWEKEKKTKRFEFQSLMVRTRNADVTAQLSTARENSTAKTHPKVFCVSNTLYRDNRRKNASMNQKYIELSGIPNLRRYCIGIVADSHCQIAKQLVNVELPALLGSIQLWVEAGANSVTVEQKKSTLVTISSIDDFLRKLEFPRSPVVKISGVFQEDFQKKIYNQMITSATKWSSSAEAASKLNFQNYHSSTYSAFCRNFGQHHTAAVGYRDWNEEAIASLKGDLLAVWRSFAECLEKELGEVTLSIKTILDDMLDLADPATRNRESPIERHNLALSTLHGNLWNRKAIILAGMEKEKEKFRSGFTRLETDTLGSLRTCFIGTFMEETYDEANRYYGKGSTKSKASLVGGRYGSESLFQDMRCACQAEFNRLAGHLQNRMRALLDEQIECIKVDLRALQDENAISQSELNPEFRDRVMAKVKSAKKKIKKAQELIQEASVLG